MSDADKPRRAFPYAPHWTMPTPCPHPRPVRTAAPCLEESVSHSEGIVTGSGAGGYRPGSKHGAHVFTESLKVARSIERDAPPPETRIVVPSSRTLETACSPGQWPAACRNLARSANGSLTRQWDVGEAPSSRSTTGRRYASGALPKTWSFPYVCPFDVEKYTVSA